MGSVGREAFGRKGLAGRWPSGLVLSDREAWRRMGRRAGKPFGGTVRGVPAFGWMAQRVGKREDGRVQRAGKPSGETAWRSGGLRVPLHRAGTRGDGTVRRIELLSSCRFDGMGIFGSPDQRTERLKTDRSRRRQEGSSEHAARTPRPSTWRLHLFHHPT